MITVTATALGFGFLILLMCLGFHVAFAMFAVSILGAYFYLGVPATLEYGTQYWSATNNFVLVAVPLFVLLGELLVRGGFTDRMYRSLADWLGGTAGRIAALQSWFVRPVRRGVGIVRRNSGNHRHRGDARLREARLR